MSKSDYLNEGFRHYSRQDYQKAIECFNKAIEIDPNFDTAFNALAESYNKLGKVDEAIAAAKKMVKIVPNDPFSHTALSRLYVQKGMIDEAEIEMEISHRLAAKA